jgi:hypothetical protein
MLSQLAALHLGLPPLPGCTLASSSSTSELTGITSTALTPDEADTSSEEESGEKRWKAGSGWVGHGQAIRCRRKGKWRPFQDGAGLCSLGRWPVNKRRLPTDKRIVIGKGVIWTRCTFSWRGAAGRQKTSSSEQLAADQGKPLGSSHHRGDPHEGHRFVEIRPVGRIRSPSVAAGTHGERALETAEDPDSYFLNWVATGSVWLGVGKRRPRTPARYERRRPGGWTSRRRRS